MATKAPLLSFVPNETSEAEEANRLYEEAQQRLMNALEARKNRLFDPTLLAVAQGFLAPTPGGSFWQSLGNVAGRLRDAQSQQEAEEQKIAEMRLNLAQQGLGIQQQKQRQQMLQSMMGVDGAQPTTQGARPTSSTQPPGQPPVGLPSLSAGEPAAQGAAQTFPVPSRASDAQAAIGDKPPGMEGVQGIPIMPPNPEIADRRALLAAAIREPGRSMFDVAKELQDLQRRRYKEHPEGMVDLATGLLYRIKKPIDVAPVTIQPRTIPGLEGQSITVPTDLAKQWTEAFNEAVATGNADKLRKLERSLVTTFAESPARVPEEKAADPTVEAAVRQAAGPASRGRIMTAEEMATASAAQKEMAIISAKDKATRTSTMMQNAETASNNLPIVEQVNALAQSPSADRIMGAFTNNKILSQVVRLAETGVSGPGFSIGIPAVRDVANNMKLTPQEQTQLQLFGQNIVRLQLSMTSAERGAGAVSNFERELYAKSKITENDLPQTVTAKVKAMGRMYKYQMDVADRLQASGMQYDDYIRTPEGRNLYRQYLGDVKTIIDNLPAGRTAPRPARSSNRTNPDRQAVDSLLGNR